MSFWLSLDLWCVLGFEEASCMEKFLLNGRMLEYSKGAMGFVFPSSFHAC